MTTVPSGTGARIVTRSGITLIGRNHTWSAPMSDMQREMAEPRFTEERGERWWQSLLLWLAIGSVAYIAWGLL